MILSLKDGILMNIVKARVFFSTFRFTDFFSQQGLADEIKNKNKIHSDHFPIE